MKAALNADLYEIAPQQPYTSADLNYGSANSRAEQEINDPNARPAISGSASLSAVESWADGLQLTK